MKLKVCGLNNVTNIEEVIKLPVDFVGFIFYAASLRNCTISSDVVKELNIGETKKVGVFVNESVERVMQVVNDFGLDYAQLHGGEDLVYCRELKNSGTKIIKVFSVDDSFNMEETNKFQFCDYLLFDTKGESPGGNGKQFNWEILNQYNGTVPFILSGGIELSHSKSLKTISKEFPLLSVLDINSKFEIEPGLKKIDEVEAFVNEIKNERYV